MGSSENMPIALTERNGFIFSHGLKIVRGGVGEFLICNGENCIGVCKTYGAAMAFTNGYFQGKSNGNGRFVEIDDCGDAGHCDFHARGNDRSAPCSGGGGRHVA